MLTGLYSAASAVAGAEQQQEAIAQNLAYINVPGYRRVVSSFATSGAKEGDETENTVGTQPDLTIDFSPGPYVQTGRALDVALEGDAFFAIQTPRGTLFTRDGVMQILDGKLVNNAGYAYQGVGQIPPNVTPAELSIDRQGGVSFQGQPLGRLEVVRFADNQRLLTAGPTAFAAPDDMGPEPAADFQLIQGSRELSNVNATEQLVAMLIGMRYHEAAQRSMNSLSDSLHEHILGDK